MTASTVLLASNLTDTHPELPKNYRTTIGRLLAFGWPEGYECEACELPSYVSWRCSRCGRSIA